MNRAWTGIFIRSRVFMMCSPYDCNPSPPERMMEPRRHGEGRRAARSGAQQAPASPQPASAGLGLHLRHRLTRSMHAESLSMPSVQQEDPPSSCGLPWPPSGKNRGRMPCTRIAGHLPSFSREPVLSCTPRGRSLLQSKAVYFHQVPLGPSPADDGVQ